MDWIKKYWIVPVIIVIIVIVAVLLYKKETVETGEITPLNDPRLATNDNAFINFGLQVSFNLDKTSVNIKAQGNGNAVDIEWSKARDNQFHFTRNETYTLSALSEIPNNYDVTSYDQDFYLNIRSVKNYGGDINYCVITVWSPNTQSVDVMQPMNSIGCVKVDWYNKTIQVIKGISNQTDEENTVSTK